MLVGTYTRRLDDKWRLPIPGEIFAPGFEGDRDNLFFAPADGHLILFSATYFHRLAEQLFGKRVMGHRDLRAKFFGNSYAKQRDKNGRIQIPEPLREWSGLTPKEDVVLVGTGPYVELRAASQAPAAPRPEEITDIFSTLESLGNE